MRGDYLSREDIKLVHGGRCVDLGNAGLGLFLDELILAFDANTAIDHLSKSFLILDCDIFRSYHIRDSL